MIIILAAGFCGLAVMTMAGDLPARSEQHRPPRRHHQTNTSAGELVDRRRAARSVYAAIDIGTHCRERAGGRAHLVRDRPQSRHCAPIAHIRPPVGRNRTGLACGPRCSPRCRAVRRAYARRARSTVPPSSCERKERMAKELVFISRVDERRENRSVDFAVGLRIASLDAGHAVRETTPISTQSANKRTGLLRAAYSRLPSISASRSARFRPSAQASAQSHRVAVDLDRRELRQELLTEQGLLAVVEHDRVHVLHRLPPRPSWSIAISP